MKASNERRMRKEKARRTGEKSGSFGAGLKLGDESKEKGKKGREGGRWEE